MSQPIRCMLNGDRVSPEAAAQIRATKAAGGRVIPVGTTALRLIESAARSGKIEPWEGDTDIFIYPGFEFHVTDALMTNFHLPKSTLLMLVSALMGQDRMRDVYTHAIARKYRFFSYGDGVAFDPLKGAYTASRIGNVVGQARRRRSLIAERH